MLTQIREWIEEIERIEGEIASAFPAFDNHVYEVTSSCLEGARYQLERELRRREKEILSRET